MDWKAYSNKVNDLNALKNKIEAFEKMGSDDVPVALMNEAMQKSCIALVEIQNWLNKSESINPNTKWLKQLQKNQDEFYSFLATEREILYKSDLDSEIVNSLMSSLMKISDESDFDITGLRKSMEQLCSIVCREAGIVDRKTKRKNF